MFTNGRTDEQADDGRRTMALGHSVSEWGNKQQKQMDTPTFR